jgi:hypothetical protein
MEALARLADFDAKAKAETAAALVAVKEAETKLPELPAHLKRCLSQAKQAKSTPRKKTAKGNAGKAAGKQEQAKVEGAQSKTPSADTLVIAKLEAARKRDTCARLLLKWYEDERAKGAKVAAK